MHITCDCGSHKKLWYGHEVFKYFNSARKICTRLTWKPCASNPDKPESIKPTKRYFTFCE